MEGRAPINGMSAFIKLWNWPHGDPLPFPPCEDPMRRHYLRTREQDSWICGHLDLGFLRLQTVGNTFLLVRSYPVSGLCYKSRLRQTCIFNVTLTRWADTGESFCVVSRSQLFLSPVVFTVLSCIMWWILGTGKLRNGIDYKYMIPWGNSHGSSFVLKLRSISKCCWDPKLFCFLVEVPHLTLKELVQCMCLQMADFFLAFRSQGSKGPTPSLTSPSLVTLLPPMFYFPLSMS